NCIRNNHPDKLESLRSEFAIAKGRKPEDINVENAYYLLFETNNPRIFRDDIIDLIEEAKAVRLTKPKSLGSFLNEDEVTALLAEGDIDINPPINLNLSNTFESAEFDLGEL